MKKRTLIISIALAVVVVGLIIYSAVSGKEKEVILETKVKQGPFEISVMVTGELQALNETEIKGPSELRSRNLRIYRLKIKDLIDEGTMVDSGDWVATLDRSEADNTLKDVKDEIERDESAYTRAKIDTTIQLRGLRDNLINLSFIAEEAEITLEQSKFEPPATIRQAEISLERAERNYEQAKENYVLRVRESQARVREAEINLDRRKRRQTAMEDVLDKFDITAPAPGMVIYKREWSGAKRMAGSEIDTWDLTVATLPDLSKMISRTYVNEIDISKVKVDQIVEIGVDAFPEKEFTGRVIEVANIGEQLPNTDAKVFEVKIELIEKDDILRPSMTTSNRIVTNVFEEVIYVPLEAVRANDSISFVYTKDRNRQILMLGESNENEIIIEEGLQKGEVVYLSTPKEAESFALSGLELIPKIKEKKAEEQRLYEEEQRKAVEKPATRPAGAQFMPMPPN
ncbi:MAG: efflux RND transporter periplasmic adaptor subunit [Bacteroidales bacterium]|jgi:HlyD family secretion protein|nr:efflux RND transporter periplasmic adaptor subunit [Bacteroidales bacterium]